MQGCLFPSAGIKADSGWLKLASPERSTPVTPCALTNTIRTLEQVKTERFGATGGH